MYKIITAAISLLFASSLVSQENLSRSSNLKSIILGGGCFWCTEAVFESISGVQEVISGYAGGHVINPSYKDVCSGTTGHAEVVKVLYDSTEVTLNQILNVFFSSHNPTTKDRQGADVGSQYRSIIIYENEKQFYDINVIINNFQSKYENPIVTEIKQTKMFYPAEVSHQDYYINNKYNRYCSLVITPKVESIKENFEWIIK
tara:strand:+ start:659 stop:1264 length:606 start_codon:yes stop_codon:yes gene_type:complete